MNDRRRDTTDGEPVRREVIGPRRQDGPTGTVEDRATVDDRASVDNRTRVDDPAEAEQTVTTADVASAAEPQQQRGAHGAGGAPVGPGGGETAEDTGRTPLFTGDDTQAFRSRWESIQTGFVDDPRIAVERADGLVAELMKRLAQTFAEERAGLESQWDRGDDVSTEDLRVAMQRYRSFFERLLSL